MKVNITTKKWRQRNEVVGVTMAMLPNVSREEIIKEYDALMERIESRRLINQIKRGIKAWWNND